MPGTATFRFAAAALAVLVALAPLSGCAAIAVTDMAFGTTVSAGKLGVKGTGGAVRLTAKGTRAAAGGVRRAAGGN